MKLLNRIQTAAQTRHDIIHGVVIEKVERSGEATMVRVIRSRDGIEKRRFQVTTEDIFRAALEAQDLGGRVLY
jgi:histidinol dehydrogenase